jgi:glycosyltransferase involved in cell wall biosynthesis
MRILLASNVSNNKWTGMGKWAHAVAEALVELGHEPTLWFSEEFPALKRTGRFSTLSFPLALARSIVQSRSRFDVVVIHEPSGWTYGLLRRLSSNLPPIVLMCHNVENKVYEELLNAAARGFATIPYSSRIKAPLFRLWQSRLAARLADCVVCLSMRDRKYLTSRVGLPDTRVVVMRNGVEFPQVVRKQRDAATNRVLFVGGWFDVKGRHLLPAIWSLVREQSPEATLTLVGTGADSETVLRGFSEQDRCSVTVIPKLENPESMMEVFFGHSILLMPSLTEGSPLALLEAMSAETPAVAANVGGIPDIITHGENGILFQSMDLIAAAQGVRDLIVNPTITSELGRAARKRASELTWGSAAKGLMAAIEVALANH